MRDDGRARLLAAASRLFAERGFSAVSMSEISEASGLSKPGIYHHVAGKEELLVEILRGELEAEAPLVEALADRGKPWRERLGGWIEAVLALPPERSRVALELGKDASRLRPELREAIRAEYRSRFLGPLAAFFAEGEERGMLRPGTAEIGLWILLGSMTPFLSVGGAEPLRGTEAGSRQARGPGPLLLDCLLRGIGGAALVD